MKAKKNTSKTKEIDDAMLNIIIELVTPGVIEKVRKWISEEYSNINENQTKDKMLETRVTEIIHQLGIPAHIKGYDYLRTAILLSIENKEMLDSVTKTLYPTIAKEYKTTPTRVERAMRHAIEIAWTRGDMEMFDELFGYSISTDKGRPTNSEFIAAIVDKIKLE